MRERLGKELLFLDGGMGTLLQERGLKPGELPETWNLKRKEEIIEIHRQYYEAGSWTARARADFESVTPSISSTIRCTLFSGWASVRPSELTCTP